MHNVPQHLAPPLQHGTWCSLFLLFEGCIFLGFHLLKWNWGIRKLRLFSNNGIILEQMDSPRNRNNLLYLQSTSLNTVHSVCRVFVSTSLLPKLHDLKPPRHCALDLTLHLMTTESLCIPPWSLTPQTVAPLRSLGPCLLRHSLCGALIHSAVSLRIPWFFEHLQSDFPNHWTGPQVTMTCSLTSLVSFFVSILLSLPEIHTHAGLTFRSLFRSMLSRREAAWKRENG